MTDFEIIYNHFLGKITDDMYMELTEKDTYAMLQVLLIAALPYFEFPRVDILDYDVDAECFNIDLNAEEINIISNYMVVLWIDRQLASIENTRMKYSGTDFKFTSQANHMQKLLQLKKDYERLGFHLQRLYGRRKQNKKGIYKSTFGNIMKAPEVEDEEE